MKNKKTIMLFSSLLILIFHLWINISDRTSNLFEIENFIRKICYIGVDIFFFLSSYSISKYEIKNYKNFILNRFIKVYLIFILFAVIGAIYYNWDLKTFLLTISSIELFIKGGGSFLWFVPTLMIIYILLPLFNKIDNKYKIKTPIITLILWLLFTVIISTYTSYNQIFIFTNRIPIILLGCYCSKCCILDKLNSKKYLILMILLLLLGIFISYKFNHVTCLYINDVFYLITIPLILGLILLINLITTNKIIDKLGSVTLEMYGIQMLFGFKISSIVYILIKNALLSNLITITIIILLALIMNYIIKFVFKKIKLCNIIQNINDNKTS